MAVKIEKNTVIGSVLDVAPIYKSFHIITAVAKKYKYLFEIGGNRQGKPGHLLCPRGDKGESSENTSTPVDNLGFWQPADFDYLRRGCPHAVKFIVEQLKKRGIGKGWRVCISHAGTLENAQLAPVRGHLRDPAPEPCLHHPGRPRLCREAVY